MGKNNDKVFVIANGGSIALQRQELGKLKYEDTIACNGWYPYGKKVFGFNPTYYCVGDVAFFQSHMNYWNNFKHYKDTNCVFSLGGRAQIDFNNFFKGKRIKKISKEILASGLSNDGHDDEDLLVKKEEIWRIDKGLYRKFGRQQDVTAMMMMLAFHHNYKKICVLGVDFGKKYTGYFWDLNRKAKRKSAKLEGVYKVWNIMKKRSEKIGAKIYMCNSEKYNKLDIFSRLSFEEALIV